MCQLFTNWENHPRFPLFVVRTSLDSDQFHQILQLASTSRLPIPRSVLGSIGYHPLQRLPPDLSAFLLHYRNHSDKLLCQKYTTCGKYIYIRTPIYRDARGKWVCPVNRDEILYISKPGSSKSGSDCRTRCGLPNYKISSLYLIRGLSNGRGKFHKTQVRAILAWPSALYLSVYLSVYLIGQPTPSNNKTFKTCEGTHTKNRPKQINNQSELVI
eukprot:sb/3470059/